jgi:hypothetical protein
MKFVAALLCDGLAYGLRAEGGHYLMLDYLMLAEKRPDAARRYRALSPKPVP